MQPSHHALLQDLQSLLTLLRQDGYTVGLGDLAALHTLVLRLIEHGGLEHDGDSHLEGMCKALLCSNQSEQERFSGHFRAWLRAQRQPEHSKKKQQQSVPLEPLRAVLLIAMLSVLLAVTMVGGGALLCKYGVWHCAWIESPTPVNMPPTQEEQASIKPEISQPEPIIELEKQPVEPAPPVAAQQLTQAEPPVTEPGEPLQPEPVETVDIKPSIKAEPSWWQQIRDFIPSWLPWLLLFSVLWWLIQRLNRRYLRRRLGAAPQHFEHLLFHISLPKLFQSATLSHTFQQLRRHEAVATHHLDVHATLESSVRNLGLFTPVNLSVQQRPEYLVLVDRGSPEDPQAALVDGLLQRLEDEGIVFSRWYFEHDPRWCYASADDFTLHALADLGGRYAGRRLLIFSNGHRFIDPLTGRPADWLEQLTPWPRRVLLSLEPSSQWRYLQTLLFAEGLLVAPADAHGLEDFVAGLHSDMMPARDYPDRPYPALLSSASHRWLLRQAPPAAEQHELLQQLQAFLEPEGYRWLAACAVYPELHWPLTLYLGEKLDVLEEKRLARLVSLPWLRRNYLPDWLRLALLKSLCWWQRWKLHRYFFRLLVSDWKGDGQTTVDTPLSKPKSATHSTETTDYISVEFLAGNLGVPVPGMVSKREWRSLLLTLVLGTVAFYFQGGEMYSNIIERLVYATQNAEEQEISRLDLHISPQPIQLTLTRSQNVQTPKGVVDKKTEIVNDGQSLWLHAGDYSYLAEAEQYLSDEGVMHLQSGKTTPLNISLISKDKLDTDNDGISDSKDQCQNTPLNVSVDALGCPPDSDGDTIPDYQDACLNNNTEEISKGVDAKGCPVDNDGDRVPDYQDACLNNNSEEISKGVDAKGCAIDSDGDGLPDYRDKCPNTPADVVTDEQGCPLDGDGDKVADYQDACPNNSSEEISKGVDTKGCPVDNDGDGLPDYRDVCPNTRAHSIDKIDAEGCVQGSAELKLEVYPANARVSLEPENSDKTIELADTEQSETREPEQPPDSAPSGLQILPLPLTAYQDELPDGGYTLRAEAQGFTPFAEKITLKAGEAFNKRIELQHLDGQISLTLQTIPTEARVKIMNILPVYQNSILLKPGKYDLEVSHEGYADFRQNVQLDKDSLLQVSLARLYKLTLKLTPENALVRFVGSEHTYQPNMSLPAGEYRLEVSHPNYLTKQETVKLEGDTELNIALF